MSDLETLLSGLKVVALQDVTADLIQPARSVIASLKGNMTASGLAAADTSVTGEAINTGVALVHDEAAVFLDWVDAELGKLGAHAAASVPTPVTDAPTPPTA